MTIQNYLMRLKDKPKFYILFCKDSELRPIYINKFVEAHGGKPVYRTSMDIGKQPRQIGPKPVYIVMDWDTALKKPAVWPPKAASSEATYRLKSCLSTAAPMSDPTQERRKPL